tara:strand:- start:602 stop:1030 length:429 start_codon:yes stop_codon:yes gene_type:complete
MDIKQQLQEIYATETRLTEESSWISVVHSIILFLALLYAPLSGAIKVIIFVSVTGIISAIDMHRRKVVIDNARANVYLRGIFYLQREKDTATADEKELVEFTELTSEDPMEAYPQFKYGLVNKSFLIFGWLVSIGILGLVAI